jgi:hypothetical protein
LKILVYIFLIIFTTYLVNKFNIVEHMALTDEFWYYTMFISFFIGLISSSTLMPKIKYTLEIIYNILFYGVIVITVYYIKHYDLY